MPTKKLCSVRFLLVAVFAVALSLVAFAMRPNAASPGNRSPSEIRSNTASSLIVPDRPDLKALVFEVRPHGFIPNEVVVPAGRYVVVLQNRSGRRDLTFRLERENGERLHEVRQVRLDSKKQLQLDPGTYTLTEVNHPEWRSAITVTSR